MSTKNIFSVAILLILIGFFISAPHASARSSVTVRNNTNGEESSVHIESNNSESSSIQLNQTNGKTNIRLEKNGDVKTFETNGDEDISWESEDKSSQVKVNASQRTTQNDNQTKPTPTPKDEKDTTKDTDEQDNKQNQKDISTEPFSLSSIFDSLRTFFSSFFS